MSDPQIRPYPSNFIVTSFGIGNTQSSTTIGSTGSTAGYAVNPGSTNIYVGVKTSFTGGLGSKGYTVDDVVFALKSIGVLAT